MYHVKHDIPLADIPFAVIKEIIEKHKKLEKKRTVAPRMASYNSEFISDKLGLRCMDIAPPINPTYNGDEVKGAHPFHTSETGTNFSINTRDNLWHCWNHKTGGDALMLYAMSKGIIDCKEAQRGCLKGRWAEIFAELKHDGYDLVEAGIEDPVFGKREEIRELLESLGVF